MTVPGFLKQLPCSLHTNMLEPLIHLLILEVDQDIKDVEEDSKECVGDTVELIVSEWRWRRTQRKSGRNGSW